MKTNFDFGWRLRPLVALWAVAVVPVAVAAEAPGGGGQVMNPFGQTDGILRSLTEMKRRQVEASASWKVLHGFRFDDRWEASGITFEQRPVDDGARNYKAVHYDHGTGLAVADVDADGRPDLYFVNQIGGNQLWHNLGGGRFEDWTGRAGVGLAERVCVAASFGDLDNDGLPDLVVTTVRMGTVIFLNRGGGRFEDGTARAGIGGGRPAHSSGVVLFDYDRDGLLDLFVTNVGVYTRNEKGRGGFYLGRSDAFQGWQFPSRTERSVLYRNLGGGRFEDASAKAGLDHRGWSGDATACDVNGDGAPDLYVLSMSGADRYYENTGRGGFVDRTADVFPRTPWGSMGVKFFDFNLDGRLDLYVTDMHSDMTTLQIKEGDRDFSARFEKLKSDPWCSAEWSPAALQRASNSILGNAFFRNDGGGRFVESSASLGLETYWPWGVTAADLNADGFEDLFVTAGMGYPLRYAINSVLLNEAGGRFVDAEFVLGVEPRAGNRIEKECFQVDCSGEDKSNALCRGRTGVWRVIGSTSSRSGAAVDLDGDGDLDLVTNEWNDRPQVLVSDLSARRPVHRLEVRLRGTSSNRDGLGATVRVTAGGRTQVRYNDGKSGYLSQSSMPLYFGMGDSVSVDEIEVIWPTGRRQAVRGPLAMDRTMEIIEER